MGIMFRYIKHSSLSLIVMEKFNLELSIENELTNPLYSNISVNSKDIDITSFLFKRRYCVLQYKQKRNSISLLVTEIFEFKDFFNTFSTVLLDYNFSITNKDSEQYFLYLK